MSILIKGMEMPTSGTYEVSIDNSYGKDKTVMSLFVRGDGGLICCGCYEIVPVPPHGRLIDADALEYEEAYLNGHYELGDVELVTRKDIESAPTIIPAELPVHHGTFAATSEQEALKRIVPTEEKKS